jgi:hypothetical protein
MLRDFTEWEEYEGASEGSGRSDKIWLINRQTDEVGLFKYLKSPDTKEHISEKLAKDIADLIHIECAKIDIGRYNGREGCMSYLINESDDILIEGIYLINREYPFYDPETLYDSKNHEYYSIEMITKVLSEYNLVYDFMKIVIFDFIIGNTDRHQSNWAVLQNKDTIRMSPLYDNGSSLCCYIKEGSIGSYLGKDEVRFNSLVQSKSKSRIRIEKSIKKEPTHIDVAKYVAANYRNSDLINWIKDVVSTLDRSLINEMVFKYDDELVSQMRKKLICYFIEKKIYLLNSIFLRKEG